MKRLDNSHLPSFLWSHVIESTGDIPSVPVSKYFKSFDLKNMRLKVWQQTEFQSHKYFQSRWRSEIVKWLVLYSEWKELTLGSWIFVFWFEEFCILILATYHCTWYKIGDLKNGSKFLLSTIVPDSAYSPIRVKSPILKI